MNKRWQRVRLGDILKLIWREEKVDPSSEYRLLGTRWYGGGLFIKEVCLGQQIRADRLYRVQKGDFVYNRLFAWKGSFALAGSESDGCYVSNEFPCFEVDQNYLDGNFLRWYFRREITWNEVLNLSTGATPTSRNRLKEQAFLNLEIPLPPLPEQRRIGAKINQLTAKIAEARQLKQKIHAEVESLLRGFFTRLIEGAPVIPMREIAPLVRRPVKIDPMAEYPELGIRSFGKGTFHKPALTGLEVGTKRLYRIEPGDLLFNNVFAWEGAVAIAKPDDVGRFGSHRFIACVPKSGAATANFLCFFFLTPKGLEKLGEASPGGAGRNRTLGLEALAEIDVPLPPIEKQRWFDGIAAKSELAKRLQTDAGAKLDALIPSILDKTFKGEF